MKLALDHLVIAAPTLDAGTEYVAELLGVAPQSGGAHAAMGTHNRVLGLFGGIYLEVIAVNPDARRRNARAGSGWTATTCASACRLVPACCTGPRAWSAPPTWHAGRRSTRARSHRSSPMQRGDLHWRITVPEDGSLPAWQGEAASAGDGLLPSLIQWDVAPHPGASLPRQDLALRRLAGHHPHAELLRQGLAWLGAEHLIALEQADGPPRLTAEIETPQGIRTLR